MQRKPSKKYFDIKIIIAIKNNNNNNDNKDEDNEDNDNNNGINDIISNQVL